jgi:arylsulfatase A-like enzyme
MQGQPGLTRRGFLGALAAGGAWALGCAGAGSRRRPNLVVLVTDDQRADTLGCMGNAVVRTPHVDALAADGTVFEHTFVTTSVCPSSRASILTGQYTRRHHIRDFATPLTPAELVDSYPLRLRAEGYRTGFFGKWGVGAPLPRDAFDVFVGFTGQGAYEQQVGGRTRHLTDLLADDAIAFLETQPRDRPFCISISFKAPHGPWNELQPGTAELYRGVSIPLPETATAEAAAATPAFLRASLVGERGAAWIGDREGLRIKLALYYALISGVDLAVGRLVDALERLGLGDDTVILYTSDNGLLLGEHGLVGKWVMYEESIRVPLVIRDPRLPASLRGSRVGAMALNIDVAPTLLELAGLSPSPRMQGRSLAPLLRGEPVAWRDDWFYEHDIHPQGGYLPTVEGVRTNDWKYVRYLDPRSDRECLYDLRADPHELRDAIERPDAREVAERLRGRWREYRESVA